MLPMSEVQPCVQSVSALRGGGRTVLRSRLRGGEPHPNLPQQTGEGAGGPEKLQEVQLCVRSMSVGAGAGPGRCPSKGSVRTGVERDGRTQTVTGAVLKCGLGTPSQPLEGLGAGSFGKLRTASGAADWGRGLGNGSTGIGRTRLGLGRNTFGGGKRIMYGVNCADCGDGG